MKIPKRGRPFSCALVSVKVSYMPDPNVRLPAKIEIQKSVYKIRFLKIPPHEIFEKGSVFRLFQGRNAGVYFVSSTTLGMLEERGLKFEIVKEIPPDKTGVSIQFPLETILHDLPGEDVREEIVAFAIAQRERGEPSIPVYCGRTQDEIPGSFVLDRPGGFRKYRWRWDRHHKIHHTAAFRDHFPKLTRKMLDPDTRFVVSLGSGGLRMFAHPTMFRLIEAMGARDAIEEIWGCSGGAIAGLAYALGADHQILEREGYDLYHRKYDLHLSPTLPELIKNVIMDRLLPGTTMNLRGFVDIQTSMQESLARVAQHSKPSFPFFAIAYNLDTKHNEVLTPGDVDTSAYKGLIKHCSPINSVLASAAIPVLFVPCVIKRGKTPFTYIDGSLSEEVPLPSVHQKWLIDRKEGLTRKKKLFILAVNLFPYLSTWKLFNHFLAKYVPFLELAGFLSRLADLARRARIDEQIRAIHHDPNAYVAEVSLPRLSMINFLDPRIIPVVIEKAHGTFLNQLLEIEQRLP